jgi:hypothetical protein
MDLAVAIEAATDGAVTVGDLHAAPYRPRTRKPSPPAAKKKAAKRRAA